MSKIKPNLPENSIKKAFVSYIFPNEMLISLEIQGVLGIRMHPSKNISSELRFHPDIITLNTPENEWLTEENTGICLGDKYPNDCTFNVLFADEKLICGKKTNVGYLDNKYEIIRVNQGYVKCSTVFVTEKAYITSDSGIYKALKKFGFDVLKVENNGIGLNGFGCGFIGGCAGKITKSEIVFTGSLEKYPYGVDIKSFCKNYGVDCISLSDKPLYDYGGILPIIS